MHKRVSPAQAAKFVLGAFPYMHAGAEISSNHVASYFRRQGLPVPEMVAGVHYASSVGWIERTALQSLRLTQTGLQCLESRRMAVPESAWHAWAHV